MEMDDMQGHMDDMDGMEGSYGSQGMVRYNFFINSVIFFLLNFQMYVWNLNVTFETIGLSGGWRR